MQTSAIALPRANVGQRARTINRVRNAIIFYVGVGILSVFFMGPFVWTVISSLKDASEIQTFPPTLFPKVLHFDNYANAWSRVPFLRFYINSIVVTGLATFGQTITATLVAYGFA